MSSTNVSSSRILIIDDQPEIIHFLVEILITQGYDVRGVVNGRLAVQTAVAARPDLILLDVKMPGINGYDVCQQLKTSKPVCNIPVIFISALNETLDKLKAFEVGGVDYITKPFEVQEVLARIKTHLSLRAAQAEIYKLNHELERRVERRTVQLQTANQQLRQEIAERQEAEQALKKSEEQLRLVIDATNDAIWDWDIEKDTVFRSKRVYDFLGLASATKGVLDNFSQHIHPDDRERVASALKLHLEKGTAYDLELRMLRADGSYGWFLDQGKALRDAQGKPIRMVGAISDISARKQAEAHLRKSESRYTSLAAAVPVGIFRTDVAGQCTYVNARWCQIAGLTPNAAAGDGWIQGLHSGDRNRVFVEWKRCVQENHPFQIECRFQRPDGTVTWIYGQAVAEQDSQGQVIGYIGTITDISDRKQAEQSIQQLNQKLARQNQTLEETVAQRTQELESFSYSVSHDLRAPLRHIHGFVNALRQQLQQGETLDNPKVAHYLDIVESSSGKMGQLIDGLLTLSRAGRRELQLQTLDLRTLVDEAIDMVTPADALANIQYMIAPLPTVVGDIVLLRQVFNNLLSNAIKFSRDRNPAIIEIGTLDQSTIFIRDNGVGFSMDYVDQLFGAFQRLHSKRQFEGTGIGLSIVQQIIHRHKGKIWAKGTPDHGAIFYFTLNLKADSKNYP